MNDFTKDELKIILLDMQFYAQNKKNKVLKEAMSHVELREKIESMIDNYKDPNCIHQIDGKIKACKLCGLPSHSIPCVGGWL